MRLDVELQVPDTVRCESCGHDPPINSGQRAVFERNITHNLRFMAAAAGLHTPLWHPELSIAPQETVAKILALQTQGHFSDADALRAKLPRAKARQLVEPLRAGLAKLRKDPTTFHTFIPKNGWGDYEVLVSFSEAYLRACEEHPDAVVHASR